MRRRDRMPVGSHPDEFFSPSEPRRGPMAGVGQYTLFDLPGDATGYPGVSDRLGWPVDELTAYRVFDWADGDGNAPIVGPALTATGAPTAGRPTPWRLRSAAAITAERQAPGARRASAAPPVPDDAMDVVFAGLFKIDSNNAVALIYPFWSYGGAPARGWLVYTNNGVCQIIFYGSAATKTLPALTCGQGWMLVSCTMARGGRIAPYIWGAPGTDAAEAGLGSLTGANQSLTLQYAGSTHGSHLARLMIWHGVGIGAIATADWHRRLGIWAGGLGQSCGTAGSTYRRTSSRCYYPTGPTGLVHPMSVHGPPAGNVEGFGPDDEIVSVTSRNNGFTAADTALIAADAGLTVTCVDDSANLGPAEMLGPLVIRIQNPTGGTLYARVGQVINSAATCWTSIRARVVAGPIRMGWQTAAGAFTQTVAAVSTGYARSYGTAVPGALTDLQALELPANADVYLVLWCAGVGSRVPGEVPSNSAAGVSTTVAQGILTTAEVPAALLGTAEVDLVPRIWGTVVPTTADDIIRSGAINLIRTDGAGNVTSADGTNTATAAVVEADGVLETLRHSHGDRGLFVSQDGAASNLTTYDGALSTAYLVRGSCRAVRRFRVYRNPRWR